MNLYMISFPGITNKIYIGITSKHPHARFKQHCSSKKRYPIADAIRKFGSSAACITVLGEYENWDQLYEAEQIEISARNCKVPNGFNLTDGGKGTFGLPASQERKSKISRANRGRTLSPEHRKIVSESNKRRDMSKQVEAMRIASLGKTLSDAHKAAINWTGRKHTPEAKARMSEAAKKRRASPETRAKMSAAIKGRKMSAESLAKRRATTERNRLCRQH